MHFRLIDQVIERQASRLVAIKQVSLSEEYLQDHFPTFPVLPGVLMLEAMTQAARELADPDGRASPPLVLGGVRALKYGRFVTPGSTIRVTVERKSEAGHTPVDCKGTVEFVGEEGGVAASGRISLRPAVVPSVGAAGR
ncbi:MAG: beta-hydroxyacyl-ACP dehydratase [Phycisphaerales bacterium JB059]